MKFKQTPPVVNEAHKTIVCEGGGTYRGEMREDTIGLHLVLFDSPVTHSTLALGADKLTVEAVRWHIEDHHRKWMEIHSREMSSKPKGVQGSASADAPS